MCNGSGLSGGRTRTSDMDLYSLVPRPAQLLFAQKNAEGLVCFLTCVNSRVERW